ncbi:MAG: FAD-dependent oxidoreductase [Planctomycetia bacterium]|nr:FAD-dependent oxidoreductase [Planctomycetia bacterium]
MHFYEECCDLVVCGGGMAGVCCALAAARNGMRVFLCHDRPVLGGNASSEIRMSISGANAFGQFERSTPLATEAREGGIIEEIRLRNAMENPQRSPSVFDLILYDLCRREPNLKLFLNTSVTGAECDDDVIISALCDRQSSQESFRLTAPLFADCTGDGRLAYEAGALFREGREDKDQFKESLARNVADSGRLCSTLLIQAKWVPWVAKFTAPPWAVPFTKQDLRLRLYSVPGEEQQSLEYGYWWVEYGGLLDTVEKNEQIRDQLLALVLGVWDHIKNSEEFCGDEVAHWALSWIGFLPGKRESRRFIGCKTITQNDVLESRYHSDAIAYGGWPIDIHPSEGLAGTNEEPCRQIMVPHVYDIPLGATVSRNIQNLFFAGRNISATHVGFSSTRVMATCAVIGQGVGTAAAVAHENHMTPHELLFSQRTINTVQQRLLRDDAYLIGVKNEDETDLVRTAHIRASSELPGGEAENIRTGQTRSLHGPLGAPVGRSPVGTHRWMSNPEEGFPCRLWLSWDTPIIPRYIRIVFDTGMDRPLTLSLQETYTQQMHWGRPQEETVADFYIVGRAGNKEWLAVDVKNNGMRLCSWSLNPPFPVNVLEFCITRTNGMDHARIFEIRVWEHEL